MQKHLITEKTEPISGTNIMDKFDANLRFFNVLSETKCKSGKFVLNAPSISTPLPCNGSCQSISTIISKAKTKIEGKVSGELIYNIKCFGTVPDMYNAPNMCEFIGDSACYIKTSDENDSEETAEGLPIITLVRDYQIEGGVVREIQNTNGIKTGSGVTLGKLTAKGNTYYTIEPMWKGNEKWISCIPEGTYYLEWNTRDVSKYKDKSFDLFTEDKKTRILPENRTNILIHTGNFVTDSEGCIILGKSFSITLANEKNDGEFKVLHSKNSVTNLRALIPNGAILKITSGKSGEIKKTIK